MRKYVSILILAFVWFSSEVFAAVPTITSAIVNSGGKSIRLIFSEPLSNLTMNGAKTKFSFKVNGTQYSPSSITMGTDNTNYDLKFSNPSAIAYGSVVTVSYAGTSVTTATGGFLLLSFTDLNVDNGVSVPSVNGYLENFNDNTLTGWGNDINNDFTLVESNQELNVVANYSVLDYLPISYTIPVTVDMNSSPKVTVRVKTSTSFTMRIDVQDISGNTTNTTANILPIAFDGSYAIYTFDFTGKFSQTYPTSATVTQSQIKKVLIYANPGAAYSGTFTIDDLIIGAVPIAVTTVTVNPTSLSMNVGENKIISASIVPTNATNTLISWTSSDKTIATVGTNGVVTALKQGTATITATSLDNATITASTSITIAATVVNKSTLASEITTANSLKNAAVVGLQSGQYSQTDIDLFATAITNAETLNNDANATQATVDAMSTTLQTAISTFTSKAIVINKQALASLITTATNLTTTAVAGTQNGQYAQGDIDALSIAIVNAQAINSSSNVVQTTVDAMVTTLSNAMTVFASKVITLDKSVLSAKINSATTLKTNAVVGTQDGQYSQGAVDSLTTAISAAQMVNTNSTSQTEINAMITTLQSAIDLFSSKIISSTVTKAALQSKINDATTLKNSAIVGTHVGQYMQTDINILTTAISDAQAVNTNSSATQTVVNAMVLTLQNAMDAFVLKVVPTPSKTSLLNAINTANTSLSSAIAGTAVGQYPQLAIDALTLERNTANTINGSTSANQSEVDAELNILLTAITTFNSSKITSVTDYSLLQTAITDAITLTSNTTVGTAYGNVSQSAMTTFNNAITNAQTVKGNTSATQSQVDAAIAALQNAVTAFQSAIIKTDVYDLEPVSVSASPILFNETITVKSKGIHMKSVSLLSITGAILFEQINTTDLFSLSTSDLPNGLYLIDVKLLNGNSIIFKVVK